MHIRTIAANLLVLSDYLACSTPLNLKRKAKVDPYNAFPELKTFTADALPDQKALSADERELFITARQYVTAVYSNVSLGPSTAQDPVKCSRNSCPKVEWHDFKYLWRFSEYNTSDISGYVAADHTKRRIVLAFRASQKIHDTWVNRGVDMVPLSGHGGARVHPAFALGWESIKESIMKLISDWFTEHHSEYELLITGRGLGAGVAAVSLLDLRTIGGVAHLITFASPPVGNWDFVDRVNTDDYDGHVFRVYHPSDVYPYLPPPYEAFKHYACDICIAKNCDQPDPFRGDLWQILQIGDEFPFHSGYRAPERRSLETAFAIKDWDGGWPFFYGDVLGELPGAAEEAIAMNGRLWTEMHRRDDPVKMEIGNGLREWFPDNGPFIMLKVPDAGRRPEVSDDETT